MSCATKSWDLMINVQCESLWMSPEPPPHQAFSYGIPRRIKSQRLQGVAMAEKWGNMNGTGAACGL